MNAAPVATKVKDLTRLHRSFRERLDKVETFESFDAAAFARYSHVLERVLFRDALPAGQVLPPHLLLERFEVERPHLDWMSLLEKGEKRTGLPQVIWRGKGSSKANSSPEIQERVKERVQEQVQEQGGWILQAPHRFFDRRTGEVAMALFASTDPRNARVLFLNTKHRYAQRDGAKKKQSHNPSDVCHNEDHAFGRITQKVMQTMASNDIVQIHGFGTQKGQRGGALAIVSSGNAQAASPRAHALVKALRVHFGDQILLYPRDTSELGATTNVQGKLSRSYAALDRSRSDNGFLHIEMSLELRTKLLEDPKTLKKFQSALLSVMTTRQQGPF